MDRFKTEPFNGIVEGWQSLARCPFHGQLDDVKRRIASCSDVFEHISKRRLIG